MSVSGKDKAYIASHLSSSVGLLLEGKVKWVAREHYSSWGALGAAFTRYL